MFWSVWKSKFYGAIVLNHRVVLHAIDATPARWRGGVVAPDSLVDFHTGVNDARAAGAEPPCSQDGRPPVRGCVGIKLSRRVSATAESWPPRHLRDASSMAWRCGLLPLVSATTAAFSQRKDSWRI